MGISGKSSITRMRSRGVALCGDTEGIGRFSLGLLWRLKEFWREIGLAGREAAPGFDQFIGAFVFVNAGIYFTGLHFCDDGGVEPVCIDHDAGAGEFLL